MEKDNKKIKEAYNNIIVVCEKYNDLGSDFVDINYFINEARNHLLIVEWEEKYGIKVNHSEHPYISQCVNKIGRASCRERV